MSEAIGAVEPIQGTGGHSTFNWMQNPAYQQGVQEDIKNQMDQMKQEEQQTQQQIEQLYEAYGLPPPESSNGL